MPKPSHKVPRRRQTPLARRLAGDAAAPGPLDAFVAARRRFLDGQRIDMQALADELGVSRATLFRWVGNRDQLIAEILWSMAEPTLLEIIDGTRGKGGPRIAKVIGQFSRAIIDNEAFRSYLSREPDPAMRIVTTRSGPVQQRFCKAIEELLAGEVAAGHLDPPLDLPDLAYVLVRLAETFVFTDLITGEAPSPEKAEAAVAAFLR